MSTKPQGITPSQTVGPYFAYGLTSQGKYDWNDAFSNNLVTPDTSGERVRVEGRVFDGDGKVVPDCMLEIWQADAQAPHLVLAVFARGMLLQNYSRIYFGGEPTNADDPVLALVPMDRRATLIAQQANCNGNAVYRLDIHLQGDNEMVFFDV